MSSNDLVADFVKSLSGHGEENISSVDTLDDEFDLDLLSEGEYDAQLLELQHQYENTSGFQHHQLEAQLSLKNAFDILLDALNGNFNPNIPTRTGASPIYPSESCFYVCGRRPAGRVKDTSKKRKLIENENLKPISVKYCSLNYKNCDLWWSQDHGGLLGVVSRTMSKVSRPKDNQKGQIHGFTGRLFSLVKRERAESNYMTENFKSLLINNAPGLVQFSKVDKGMSHYSNQSESESSRSSVSISSGTTTSDQMSEWNVSSSTSSTFQQEQEMIGHVKTIESDMRVDGDLVIHGELSARNLHVKGNLLVEGSISGQLVTPPGSADYAEWFAFLNCEDKIKPGMVVQLRSPQQKITLDTSQSGPHMVVSTTPSVAAGVPPSVGGEEPVPGALCAFLGQVPVNVRGPIECGQYLFPSGENDGFAVAAGWNDYEAENEPLGTAMESCGPGNHTVLTFVRWQHNLKFQIMKQEKNKNAQDRSGLWLTVPAVTIELVFTGCYYHLHSEHYVDRMLWYLKILSLFYCLTKFPAYVQFVVRGDIFVHTALSCVRIMVVFYKLASLLITETHVDAYTLVCMAILKSEHMFISKSFTMANGIMWRGEYRYKVPAWVLYDKAVTYLYDMLLEGPADGMPCPMGDYLSISEGCRTRPKEIDKHLSKISDTAKQMNTQKAM